MSDPRTVDSLAEVTRYGVLDMQVCVPHFWTDEQVQEFANRENPMVGPPDELQWFIRREGNELLRGDPERALCREREGFVHVVLDC